MTDWLSRALTRTLPWGALPIVVLMASACGETAVTPELDDELVAVTVDTALPAVEGSTASNDVPGHLERLLHQAVHTVGTERGADAARALTDRLRQLQLEARRAREAGDEAGYRAAAEAAHLEAARIVVATLGTGPLHALTRFVVSQIREVSSRLRQAHAAGADVHGPMAVLRRAEALLQMGRATDRAPHALVAVTSAADLLSRLGAPTDRAGTLFNLLGHALHSIAQSQGAEAAAAIQAELRALSQAVAEAHKTDSRARLEAAVDALESAAARVVIAAFGSPIVERVLRAGADGIHTLEGHLRRLHATDRDTSGLRRLLATAVEIHHLAVASARSGDAHQALRLGARVLDILGSAHD